MADMTRNPAGKSAQEPLWDRPRVAAAVGISVRTLEYLDSVGKGPPRIRIGGAVRYAPAEVRAWIEASREP